jgi:hypothetical protein
LGAALIAVGTVLVVGLERLGDALHASAACARFSPFLPTPCAPLLPPGLGRAARFIHMLLGHVGQFDLRIGGQARQLLLILAQLLGGRLARGGNLERIFDALDRQQVLAGNRASSSKPCASCMFRSLNCCAEWNNDFDRPLKNASCASRWFLAAGVTLRNMDTWSFLIK